MTLRAALFDLDGTLIDSAADLAASVNAARAATGFPAVPEATVRGWIGDGVNVLLTRAIPDPALVPRALEAFRAHYAEHLLDATVAFEGVPAALDALRSRGVRLAVVTNKAEGFSRRILEALGIEARFGAVVGSDSGHGRKPEAGPALAALAALGARPEEAVMVGDGRNDVLVARAAGIRACVVGWGIGWEEARELRPDLFVARVEGLAAALLGEPWPP